ncbi:GNAT family N-acetyltransferase [Methylobacterium sp. DB1607]|nr:GNAT family N-acetyltransferase [Methylobacterium sp. DB1607]
MGQATVVDLTNDPDWDEAIWQQPGASIYASRRWGEYKRRIGWDVRRLAIRSCDGQALAFAQIQRRRRWLGHVVLAQGGPILTPLGERRAEAVFRAFLDHLRLGRLDLLGVNYQQFQTPAAMLALLGHGFAPVVTTRTHTLELDLTRGAERIRAGMEGRWRDVLKAAEANPDLSTGFPTDPADRLSAFETFSRLYAALKRRKGFRNSLDPAAFRDLAAHDPNLLFLEIRERGEPILVRIVHRAVHRWTDFYVASNERAKVTGAGRLALWRLIERAQREGASVLDLGGIDPAGNPGVYEFKRGVCRNAVAANPLWLFSRTRSMRRAATAILAAR